MQTKKYKPKNTNQKKHTLVNSSDPSRIQTDGWRFLDNKNDIMTYQCMTSDNSTVACVKGIGNIEAPPATIAEFVCDNENRKRFDDNFNDYEMIEKVKNNIEILRLRFKASGIFRTSKRDFCVIKAHKVLSDGTHMVMARSIGHAGCPESKDYVRARLYVGGWVIRPSFNNSDMFGMLKLRVFFLFLFLFFCFFCV